VSLINLTTCLITCSLRGAQAWNADDCPRGIGLYRQLPFTRKPVVHRIRPEQVVGITDLTGKVNDHTFITAMGLLRVGVDTLNFSDHNNGSIREKIDRMLQV